MINSRQVHDIRCLRNEFIDRILHAQRLVELARNARQRTIRRFIRRPALQIESDGAEAGCITYDAGRLGGVVLDFFDFELARGPIAG